MANLIQIKRSATNAVLPTLQPGEMAFTQSGNTLFIGSPDGSSGNIRIGGKQVPGTLTANQALVANSTGGIDRVYTANIDVNIINLNGDHGTAGHILTSNGTGPAYWSASAGVNEDAAYDWTGLHSFSANVTFTDRILANIVNATSFTTGNTAGDGGVSANSTILYTGNSVTNSTLSYSGLFVGNSTVNSSVNSSVIYASGYVNATSFNTGESHGTLVGGATVNSTYIALGNTTVNGAITSNSTMTYFTGFVYSANNSTYVGGNSALTLRTYSETMAETAYTNAVSRAGTTAGDAYTNAMADTLGFNRVYTGNNTFNGTNTVINSNSIFNGAVATLNSNNVVVRTGNLVLGDTSVYQAKYTNVIFISTDLKNSGGQTVGAAIAIGSSGGGSYQPTFAPQGGSYPTPGNVFFVNTSLIQLGNNSSYANINGGTITLNGGGVSATINSTMYSGSISSACNALQLDGVNACNYVQNTDSRTLSGNLTFTGSNTIFSSNVLFNAYVANSVVPTANLTYDLGTAEKRWKSLYVGGSTIYLDTIKLSDVSGDLQVRGGANSLSVNAVSTSNIAGVGSANLNVTSNTVFGSGVANIDATSAKLRVKDIDVSGNLTISGTLTSINTQTLIVNDNIIELASNNNLATSDIIDSGWYSTANSGGTVNFPAFGRIASNSTLTNPYFKLFTQTTNPNTASTFTPTSTGTLEAYLAPYGKDGVFIANSSTVRILANSTVSVSITANSISLGTPVGGGSGGTGFSTYTAGDLLVANSSNLIDKLALGTNGKVLQSNGSALVYDILDGGSF